ncbi:MAG: chromate transporter, partial [Deltaproteobacteria bacterium]
PLAMGVLGAVVTLWATFVPCFLWIFAGAPYIDRLNAIPALRSTLSTITSAVVGVILNLSVWFALHVLFSQQVRWTWGPIDLDVPQWTSLRVDAAVLAMLGAVLLFALHRTVLTTLAVTAAAAVTFHAAGLV